MFLEYEDTFIVAFELLLEAVPLRFARCLDTSQIIEAENGPEVSIVKPDQFSEIGFLRLVRTCERLLQEGGDFILLTTLEIR